MSEDSSALRAPIKAKSLLAWLLDRVVWLIGTLPLGLRITLGRIFGTLYCFIPSRERALSQLQLQYYLKCQAPRRSTLAICANLGQTICESINLRPLIKQGRVKCPQKAWAKEICAESRPVIALAAHTSNWELLAAYMADIGLNPATIGREARSPLLRPLLRRLREHNGVRMLWRSGSAALRDIVQELKKGGLVAALLDQDTRVGSIFVPFFGESTRTPSGLIELGKKHNARFVVSLIFREGWTRYNIQLEEIDSSLTVEEILTWYNRLLEQAVREHPTQWVWLHKRWRSLPEGKRMSSSEYIAYLKNKIKERER